MCFLFVFTACKTETYYTISTSSSPSEGGNISVSPSGSSILEGTSITFTATPNSAYLFTGWSGSLSGTENPKTVTVTADMNVIANFELKTYPLTVSVEGEGTVNERVVSTKTEYGSGTVVELTAAPSTGWSFDHWEGDLSGSDNPAQITITGQKTVKAVFTKNKYAYNLKIIGPGVVDEYLLPETKADFDYGTKILLKAIPSEGAVFKGWSGGVSDNSMELILDIDEPKEVIATFSGVAPTYPLPNLKQPWPSLKCLYKGFDYRLFSNDASGRGWIPIDYNRDGFLDVITTETFKENYIESDCDIHFYIGNPDGTFSIDPLNENGLVGKEPRKIMYSDFNDDGIPDILMVGHGTEQPEALWGCYPVILMSSSSGVYQIVRFEDIWGYHHGGAIGDIDNDGDMDILLPGGANWDFKTHTLINNGNGEFSDNTEIVVSGSGIFTCELWDINHDGFLDLIWGGGADGKWDGETWRAEVIWGDGHGFLSTNAISIIPNWDLIGFLDYEFFDLDQDGIDEIITSITPDQYAGWELEVYKWTGSDFINVTSEYFKPGESVGHGENWIGWVDFEDVDGKMYLVCQQFGDSRIYFEYKNGIFNRVIEDPRFVPQEGFVIYDDPKAPFNYFDEYVSNDNCFHCTDNPYSGQYCIKNEPGEWGYWFYLSNTQNGADLRHLVSEGYSLEFYIRHDQPDFLVEIKFISDGIDGQEGNTFCYGYWGNEHNSDGEWQRIVLPLAEIVSWDDETKESWGRINTLFFHAAGDINKCPFYVDDIRIRKVLSE